MDSNSAIFQDREGFGKGRLFKLAMESFGILPGKILENILKRI